MNKCCVHGNLTRDAVLDEVLVGDEKIPTSRCKFTVADNHKSRSNRKSVSYFECTAWYDYAQKIAPWLKKGKEVIVWGRVDLNEYNDEHGVKRTKLQLNNIDVTLVGGPKDRQNEETADGAKVKPPLAPVSAAMLEEELPW